MSTILKFPEKFLWGSATSSYQIEGGIDRCDWSKIYPAGKACDHYNRYERDFDLAKKLNQNAHRFSIEWSRIEPEQGKFDKKEIEHYRNVLLALKKRNIKSVVTLWHWTNPVWFANKGGWTNKKASNYFANYVKKITEELGGLIDFWIVLNEPLVFTSHSYGNAEWPPKEKNFLKILKVVKNLIKAHKKSYFIIKNADNKAKIGISKHNVYFEPFNQKSFLDRFSVWIVRYLWNYYFLNKIKNYQNFIGLNYYHHNRIKFPAQINKNENKIVSDIGWEIYPQGIYYVLKKLNQKYKKPIYILENGLADAQDKLRKKFIKDHLFYVHKAIQEGVDVRGYFYWSLMDNFEWAKGFEPKFGLIEIDYKTMERKIRDSAYYYAQICKNNYIEIKN